MNLDADLIEQLRGVLSSVEQLLPPPLAALDWDTCFAANWRRHAYAGYLEPVVAYDSIRLNELLGIDKQKQVVENNTVNFLKGYPANNVLLWGSRGTGKSSLIRALLNRYAGEGLRVVQIDKDDLPHLPDVFRQTKEQPYRYIVFCDDLSFESGEKSYKALKSALDGSVYAPPPNTLIYVTSNRRFLIPEYETDNLGAKLVNNEVHYGEGIEEKSSLADRFGLWVAFNAFSADQFLQVVQQCVQTLAREQEVEIDWSAEQDKAAIAWSYEKSKRCGRTALQFARYWVGNYLSKGNKDAGR